MLGILDYILNKVNEDQEKLDWFIDRTGNHIKLVKKVANKIVNACLEFKELQKLAESHDASKFEGPERDPYIEISWMHKCKNEGKPYECTKDMKRQMDEATLHHVTTNPHHPEYWLEDESQANMDPNDRDKSKSCVDASKMPDISVAEMVADWQAMSEELGKNTAREWFDKVKDVRWHFSDHQCQVIDKLLEVFGGNKTENVNEFAKRQEKVTKTFKITTNPNVMLRFENFLGFLHFNGGHSGTFAMHFDGDGDEVLKCEPKPVINVADGNRKCIDVAGFDVEIANEDGYQGLSVKDMNDHYSDTQKGADKND